MSTFFIFIPVFFIFSACVTMSGSADEAFVPDVKSHGSNLEIKGYSRPFDQTKTGSAANDARARAERIFDLYLESCIRRGMILCGRGNSELRREYNEFLLRRFAQNRRKNISLSYGEVAYFYSKAGGYVIGTVSIKASKKSLKQEFLAVVTHVKNSSDFPDSTEKRKFNEYLDCISAGVRW